METSNSQFVGGQGDNINVAMPKRQMTKEEALIHAAFLVAIADPLQEKFPAILEAVLNS